MNLCLKKLVFVLKKPFSDGGPPRPAGAGASARTPGVNNRPSQAIRFPCENEVSGAPGRAAAPRRSNHPGGAPRIVSRPVFVRSRTGPSTGEAVMNRHLETFPKTMLGNGRRIRRNSAFSEAQRRKLSRRWPKSGKFGVGVGERPPRHNHQPSRVFRTDGDS